MRSWSKASSRLALVVLAGACCSAASASAGVSVDARGALALDGRAFHQPGSAALDVRALSFPGSATVLVTWREAADPVGRTRWAIARDGRRVTYSSWTDNVVRLKYSEFNPVLGGSPAVPEVLAAGAENELYLVQMVGTSLEEMRTGVALAGGRVERFLTDHTHIVRMDAAARERVAVLPYVRWVGAYHPAYRADAATRAHALLAERGGGGMTRYSIEVLRNDGVQQADLAAFIGAIGGVVEFTQPIGTFRMEASLTPGQLVEVLRRNEVSFIDPWTPVGTDTTIARQIGGASTILQPVGISGQGVRAEVQDSEVQMNHPAWNGQSPLINGAVAAGGAHGTACYGINFSVGLGIWAPTTGFLKDREQGIFAFFGSLAQIAPGGESRLVRTQRLVDPAGQFRGVFSTNSWGNTPTTAYNTISAEMDDIVFQTGVFVLNSQGNTNSTNSRPQAWAKNVVANGGINHFGTLTRADDTHGGASFGPAADGRVKPDFAHFFDQTTATWINSGTTTFSGTSNATPIVAGHAGLVYQMWHEGVFPGFGGGSSVFASRPAFTTVRALMAASAFRYTWGGAGPNGNIDRTKQGWGMPDVGKLYQQRLSAFIVNDTDYVATGQTRSYPLAVSSGTPELLVSMNYREPAGATAGSQARVNDLNLRVTSPTGQVFLGNAGLRAGNWSTTTGSADAVDPLENVFIQNPAEGLWTVEVIGAEVVADTVSSVPGTQASFSLVALGVTPASVLISFPAGLPELVAPGQATSFPVRIDAAAQQPIPSTARLFSRANAGAAFVSSPLSWGGGNAYTATLPAFLCADAPEFYVSVQGSGGATVTSPASAPQANHTVGVGEIVTTTLVDTTFAGGLPAGFTATGLWNFGTACSPPPPQGCSLGGWAYFGLPGACNYATGSQTTGDLATVLTLPSVSGPQGSVTLELCYALQTENVPNFDHAVVMVNGVEIDRLPDTFGGTWADRVVDLTAYAGQTITLTLRFDSVDGFQNDFRGWHVGRMTVSARALSCVVVPPECYANCDGSSTAPLLSPADFVCFLNKYRAGDAYANCDGSTLSPILTPADFVCFLNKYRAGCP